MVVVDFMVLEVRPYCVFYFPLTCFRVSVDVQISPAQIIVLLQIVCVCFALPTSFSS